jgi:hypothetical protein
VKALSKRGKTSPPTPIAPDETYWLNFIQHMFGNLGSIAKMAEASPEDLQVLKDPLFEKFLRYGPGKSGIGPKTISEFLSLSEKDKRFYATVFREWKKVIKERKIPIEKLE